MTKHKKGHGQIRPVRYVLLGLVGLGLTIAMLVQGNDIALFNPQGPVAEAQLTLIKFTAAILLLVAVPSVLLLYFTAWKYRESNKKATYEPGMRHGKLFVFSAWAIPSVFMLLLALVMWPATHQLEHKNPIDSSVKPITIQVVALRWKWLFIYPEQNIATVNFVQIPVGTPVHFELTADETPMSSFWIPHLGGQLYAMTGHSNQLNLMATEPGDYPGSSAEINGQGFAGMKFIARASSMEDFDKWVQSMRPTSQALDSARYKELLKPSENNLAAFYSPVDSDLYANLLTKYMSPGDHEPAKHGGGE